MRTFLCIALATLTACGGSAPILAIPLGDLVVAGPAAKSAAVVHQLMLPASESMIWDVRAAGMTIGRAELQIGDSDVHSKFTTSKLASMFATMQHELVTTLDRAGARPHAASETVQQGRETSHSEVAFDGSGYTIDGGERVAAGGPVHTLHSALGWIRAWADPAAVPTTLAVLEDRELYSVDLDRPVHEDLRDTDTLRIDGHIHTADATIAISIWLTADADRKPVRLTITAGKFHITAELVS